MAKGIVLFDGHCNFCDASVQFILKRDQSAYFQFASIQSEIGQSLIQQYKLEKVDSLIVINRNKAFIESAAAIEIARYFGGAWKLLICVKVIPAFIRNALYRYIAKNRYKWFGQKQTCRIPSPTERERFLS